MTLKNRFFNRLCPALALLSLMASPLSLQGQSGTWTGEGDGNWENPLNWLSGVIAEGSNNTATFNPLAAAADITVSLDDPHSIKNLTFGANATGNWTLTGSALSFEGTSGTHAISVASGNTATLDTLLNAGRTVNKTGAGTLVLTRNNTGISSTFRLDAGIVEIQNAGALGQGTIVGNGGALFVNTGAAATIANSVNLVNNVTFDSTNDVEFSGTLSNDGFTRNLTWNGDGKTLTLNAINLTGSGGMGFLGHRNAILHFNGPITSDGGGLAFTNNFYQSITFSGDNVDFGGNITTQNNVGRLIARGSANALGVGGTLTLGNNQKFELIYDTGVTMTKNLTANVSNVYIILSRETDGAGVTHQMGALRLNTNILTTFEKGDHITSGTTGIGFTSTTLLQHSNLEVKEGVTLDLGGVGENAAGFDLKTQGAGVVKISGASSYTGTTQVTSASTLLLSGSGSTGSGALTVRTTALLAGAGTVGGDATIQGGGTLDATGGTLNVLGNLTFSAASSNLRISLDHHGAIIGTAPYSLALNGDLVLVLDGGPFGYRTLFSGFGETTGNFTSVTLTGAVSDTFTREGTLWTSGTLGWTLDEATGVFYAIPEPGTLGLLSLVGLGAFIYRRRRVSL